MIDTNILVSALVFPNERMNTLLCRIVTKYNLVLSSYVVDELFNVIGRKFKDKAKVIDVLLSKLPYELVCTPKHPPSGLFEIRDLKDYPVLYSAIVKDVDVFITGDKDFDDIGLEKPEILTVTKFLDKY